MWHIIGVSCAIALGYIVGNIWPYKTVWAKIKGMF